MAASKDVVLAAAFPVEGRRRAHPELMDALWRPALRSLVRWSLSLGKMPAALSTKRRAKGERPLNCVRTSAPTKSIADYETSTVASYALAKADSVQGGFC